MPTGAYVLFVQQINQAVGAAPELPEDAAFAIAADEYPSLKIDPLRARLDVFGELLARRAAPIRDPLARAKVLCDFVHRELGFRGNEDYDDPRNNFLNDVIERRTGSPVGMAVIHLAIGRRAGIEVDGVAFPGHFLVRIAGLYADPFEGGVPIDRHRLLALACDTLGDARDALASLEPVGPRTVAVRLLLNLQRIHRQRGDHARAMVVCDRLYDITRAPAHLVDRGIHALALGATRAAISDFESYLTLHPNTDNSERVRELLRKAREAADGPMN